MSVYSPSLPCSEPLDEDGLLRLEDEEEDDGFLMTAGEGGRGGGYSQANGFGGADSSSPSGPFGRVMGEPGQGEFDSYVGISSKHAAAYQGPLISHEPQQEKGQGGRDRNSSSVTAASDDGRYGSPSEAFMAADKRLMTEHNPPSAFFSESLPATSLSVGKGNLDENTSRGVSLVGFSSPRSSSYRSQRNPGGGKASASLGASLNRASGGGRTAFMDFDGGAPMQVITGYETLCLESPTAGGSAGVSSAEAPGGGGGVRQRVGGDASSQSLRPEVYGHPRKWKGEEGGLMYEEEKQSTADTAFLSNGGDEEALADVSFGSPEVSPSAGKRRGFQSVPGDERHNRLQSYHTAAEEEEEDRFFSSSRDPPSVSSTSASNTLLPPPASPFLREKDLRGQSLSEGFRGIQEEDGNRAGTECSPGNSQSAEASAAECMYTSSPPPPSEELQHLASQGGEPSANEKKTSSSSLANPISRQKGLPRHTPTMTTTRQGRPAPSASAVSCEDPEYGGYDGPTGSDGSQRSTLLGGGGERESKREHRMSLLQKSEGGLLDGQRRGGGGGGYTSQKTAAPSFLLPFSLSLGGSSSDSSSLIQWREVLSIVANRLYYSKYTAYLYAFVFLVNAWVLVRCLTLSAVDLSVVVAEVFVTTMLLFEVLLRALVVVRRKEPRPPSHPCLCMTFLLPELTRDAPLTLHDRRPYSVRQLYRQTNPEEPTPLRPSVRFVSALKRPKP